MNKKFLYLGYFVGITGLVLLVINAISYFTAAQIARPTAGSAILFCILGAVLINKHKKQKNQ